MRLFASLLLLMFASLDRSCCSLSMLKIVFHFVAFSMVLFFARNTCSRNLDNVRQFLKSRKPEFLPFVLDLELSKFDRSL